MLAGTAHHATIPLVSSGLVSTLAAEGPARSGGTTLRLDLVLRLYDRYGVGERIDAYGIHNYPPVPSPSNDAYQAISADLRDATDPFCGPSAQNRKPCWITEWGFKSSGTACAIDDSERLQLFHIFMDAYECNAHDRPFVVNYLFSWDQDDRFSVWRCNRPTDAAGILQR